MPPHDSPRRPSPPGRSLWLGSLRALGSGSLWILSTGLRLWPVVALLLVLAGRGLLGKPDTPPPTPAGRITSKLDSGTVFAMAWSPDGRNLARQSERGAILISNAEGLEERYLAPLPGPVPGAPQMTSAFLVVWSPDGSTLAANAGDALVVWDARTGAVRHVLRGHSPIMSLAFSGDGRALALGCRDGRVWTWDLTSEHLGEVGRCADLPVAWPWCVLRPWFSPDGARMARLTGPDRLSIATADSSRPATHLASRVMTLSTAAFSPDGDTLAVAGLGGVEIWDWPARRLLGRPAGYRAHISALAFSPDGRTLAVAAALEQDITLWDVRPGRKLTSFSDSTGTVCSLAFSPDGRTLAAGQVMGTVVLWEVPPEP